MSDVVVFRMLLTMESMTMKASGRTMRFPHGFKHSLRCARSTSQLVLTVRGGVALVLLMALAACRTTGDTGPAGVAATDSAPVATSAATIVLSAPPADWATLTGRRVRMAVPLTVTGRDERRPDEAIASFSGRLFTPTEIALPGSAANAVARDNARRQLRVVPSAADAPIDAAVDPSRWRVGTVLEDIEGDLITDNTGIALQLVASPRITPSTRPAPPQIVGDLRLASFNLENLFNGDGRGADFPTPRGARTAAEFDAQLGKLVATIAALQPDIAAVMELENDGDGPQSSVAALVDALNAAPITQQVLGPDASNDWRAIPSAGLAGSDQIRVGLLYRASRVTPVGRAASLADGPFAGKSRAPLAQAFRAGRGPVFVVVANHFKSKGCGDASGADGDLRDGQACWNATRLDSARRLDAWLKTDPTRSRTELTAIVGDFNAYAMEDPLRVLRDAGWQDALQASPTVPYSYVFKAQAGRLDHALLSPALGARLTGAAEWHSNADESDTSGYRDASEPGTGPTPWRSSDHDPLIIGLRLRAR